jgi:hypothetical protein
VSELTFRVDPVLPELPLEVYDADLTLLNRVLSSERMTVDAGHYYVIARLPGGGRLETTVEVPSGRPVVADLGDRRVRSRAGGVPSDRSTKFKPAEKRGLKNLATEFVRKAPRDKPTRMKRTIEQRTHEIEWAAGSKSIELEAGSTREGGWVLQAEQTVWRLPSAPRSHFDERSLELRLRGPSGPPSCSVVPLRAIRYLRPVVKTDCDARPVLATRLKHETADALLSYLDAGQIDDAEALTHATALNAERLLETKLGDPIAAAAGAFVLLALGDIDRLHDWTTNLSNWFEWLPDAVVALAEHQARLGDHKGAAETLEGLSDRGLPCLTVALALAISRMRIYVRADLGRDRMASALEDLTRYAIACDLTATVTTFSAESLWEPLPRGASTHDAEFRTSRRPKRSRGPKEST